MNAGANDRESLEAFAHRYRDSVLRYFERRGLAAADAEDLCQDVFLRLLKGNVLARAESGRGRFRSLLVSVIVHVAQDRSRRRQEIPVEDLEPVERDPDFDQLWVLHLTGRAFQRLREEDSPYYPVLQDHLEGRPVDRQKLWIARRKLTALLRDEVAQTCSSPEDFEEEVAHLAPLLRPATRKP